MAPIARTCSGPVAPGSVFRRLFCWFETLCRFAVVVAVVPVGALVLGWWGSFCVVGYVMLHLLGAWIWIITKVVGLPQATCTWLQARAATASSVSNVNDSDSYNTEASTELSANPRSSAKSAAAASADWGVLAEAAAVFEGQKKPCNRECEVKQEEEEKTVGNWTQQQEVVDSATQVLAAGPLPGSVPTSTGCADCAESACDSCAVLTEATAALDLARQEQEEALASDPEVEDKEAHSEVAWDDNWEQQQQDKENALGKQLTLAAAHRAMPSMSDEATKAVQAAGEDARDSAAAMLESQLLEIGTALWLMDTDDGDQCLKEEASDPRVEAKEAHSKVAWDDDWVQQQQDKENALGKQLTLAAAHRAMPSMSDEATKAVQAAGEDARDSAAAMLESQLLEIGTALWLMDTDDGDQCLKDTAETLPLLDAADSVQQRLSFHEEWAIVPVDDLAMAEEMRGSDIQQPEVHQIEYEGSWGLGYAADGLEVQAPVGALMLLADEDF